MNASKEVQIDVEAARALVEWKSRFAAEVCEHAKQLAAQSDCVEYITLSQYRLAAKIALQTLADAIQRECGPNAQQEAA